MVKTRLATGDMTDVFQYNSGSLLQALDPPKNLVDAQRRAVHGRRRPDRSSRRRVGRQVYGVPVGQAMGGGILYNKKVFADLGLTVPTTWDEFMANNAKIKAAGIAPVIQTYGDTWTSQLFVLARLPQRPGAESRLGRQVHREPGASTSTSRRSRASSACRRSTTRATSTRTSPR